MNLGQEKNCFRLHGKTEEDQDFLHACLKMGHVMLWPSASVCPSVNFLFLDNSYSYEVTVHQILTELCPFEIFCKHFISG